MKRRGNKSNKVPNVKLRPAHPDNASSSRESQYSCLVQDSQQCDDASARAMDMCPRPFKGVVVCATGIVDKPTLFKQAVELGAASVSAYTDRVTHLVAGEHGSEKYMCALERKIPILKPSWITESYQIWLRGDDVDLNDSVGKHRLPIFSGVVVSLSGINDAKRRAQITKLLRQQGGEYVKNLERPVRVTHLLCSGDEETDKMRYAHKFNERAEANIHLVWEEWFWDSLDFGGRFDEGRYQVQYPRPERKMITEVHSLPSSSKVLRPETTLSSCSAPEHSQDQDETEEEIGSVKRPPEVTLQVWASLLQSRGFIISAGKLVRNPSADRETGPPPPQAVPARIPLTDRENRSVISSFRRANSFAPLPKGPVPSGSHQPFRRVSTLPSLPAVTGKQIGEESPTAVSSCPSLFTGLKFLVLGEARCASVRGAIEGSGGVMVPETEADDDVDYVVVRLVSGSKLFREECDEWVRAKYRTECWLELCIYHERICSPDEHISFRPLKMMTPLAGAERICLSISGFDESESWPIRRLIRALGIIRLPNFSRQATHLLCPSGRGEKFQKALEWNIPVVNMKWLVDMAHTGVISPSSIYRVSAPGIEGCLHSSGRPEEREAPAVFVSVDKGKERAGTPNGMADITNNCGWSQDKGESQDIETHEPRKPPDDTDHGPLKKTNGVYDPLGKPRDPWSWHTSRTPSTTSQPSSVEYSAGPRSRLSPSSRQPVDPKHQAALNKIQQDVQKMRIPSSTTPSPMKTAGNDLPEATVSPVNVSSEVTKALQDSITSLLGKRQISEDDSAGKVGKRPRAQGKSKPPSRQASKRAIVSSHARSARLASPPDPPEAYEMMTEMEGEDGMRVMYEDPGQMDEKKRLMSLIESRPRTQGDPEGGRKGTKSGRIPGF